MNLYEDGDLVRVAGTFTDEDGDPADPVAVFAEYRYTSDSAVTSYEYGTDAELVKDSTGVYHFNIDTTGKSGQRCFYRLYATGTGQTAEQGAFRVRIKKPA